MEAPDFLTVEDVLHIHRDQIEQYGGDTGLRDRGLLESAVMTPRSTYDGAFLLDDISQMAAAYLFHIVRNHPFVDGNKRTGTAAALVFLDLNGVEVDADDDSLVALVLDVAQGHADRGVVAEFLRSRIVPR